MEVTPRFELQWRVLRGVKSCDFVPLCGHSVAFHGMRWQAQRVGVGEKIGGKNCGSRWCISALRVGKNSRVNGGPRFSHRPFKLSDRGGEVQGYRRTRECVPARPKLAELVRLRLPFYDRFLHAFGAVPHAGASFAGALPARGTAQTRDGGIVLNPSDWRESGTPRFSSGGPCAACTPPRLFWHRRKRRRLRSQEDDLRCGPRRGDSISARAPVCVLSCCV